MKKETNIRKNALKQFLNGVNNIATLEVISKELDKHGWTVHPVYYQNKIIGAIVEKEGSIHTSISPDFQKKWYPLPYIKTILYPALDKYGIIYSDADKKDKRAMNWLTKLGFYIIREDDERFFYAMTEKKF